MFFSKGRSVVGLDIGSSAVKAVELKSTGKGYRVVAFGTEPIPPDSIVDGAIIDGTAVGRAIDIRLVTPGVVTGAGPTPAFAVTPAAPTAFADTRFDASISTATLGTSIVSYGWNFGDGSIASGVTAAHRFSSSATFHVVRTVVDSNGLSASKSQDVAVGAGATSTANFTFSPASPLTS